MGRIAKLLSFVRGDQGSKVKSNPGGGYNLTSEHMAPAGDDSHPLPGDYVITTKVQRTGGEAVVGYADPNNEQTALPGGKRIYSRDEAGNKVAEVWLMNDGTIVVRNDAANLVVTPGGSIAGANDNGMFELEEGGDFVVNGATIDKDGNISSPGKIDSVEIESTTSLIVGGIEVFGHTHTSTTPGNPTGPMQ